MIIVRNMTKGYGDDRKILSSISFQADEGEFIALLGASGSGKSTLLRCLALLEKWDDGQYLYEGKDISSLNILGKLKIRKQWAYLAEKPDVNPAATALKNVWSGRIHNTPLWRLIVRRASTDEHVLAMDYLEKVGLLEKAQAKVRDLSGGEQQRVAIAKALVKGAKVIFADEPVTGLDPESANRVLQDLQSISKNEKVTVICSLRQVDLAEKYATRIWGLSDGKIALDVKARRLTQREKDIIF